MANAIAEGRCLGACGYVGFGGCPFALLEQVARPARQLEVILLGLVEGLREEFGRYFRSVGRC